MLFFIFIAIGFLFIYFAVGAFLKNKFFKLSNSFWTKKNYSTFKFLFSIVSAFVLGFIFILSGFGQAIKDFEDKKIMDKISIEAKTLNVPPYEFEKIKSAFVFMPKESSVSDYLKEDELAKKEGFKDAYEYLLAKYRADKEGISLEQFKDKIKAEKAKEEQEKLAKEKKMQQQAAVKKREEDSKRESENAMSSIPKGEFYTDKGQVSQAVYRAACLSSYASKKHIVMELSVGWTHSPEGKLASNLGAAAISNTRIWWDDERGKCYGSYTVSGMVDGSNYSLPFSGSVQGFDNDGSGNISGNISRY